MPHYTLQESVASTIVEQIEAIEPAVMSETRAEGSTDIGLSSCAYLAKPPEVAFVRLAVGGSLVETRPHIRRSYKPVGGLRGKVKGFSYGSRNRMRKRMAAFSRDHMKRALFVTLTYPSVFPDGPTCKAQFQAWCKRLFYKYPKAGIVWREELQQRGAPHFHVMVLGVRFIPYQWVAQTWCEVVFGTRLSSPSPPVSNSSTSPLAPDSVQVQHFQAGTEIRRVRSYKEARSYLEKYLSKVEKLDGLETDCGRLWGLKGKWEDYLAPVMMARVTGHQLAKLARVLDGIRRGAVYQRRRASGRAIRWARKRKSGVMFRGATWFLDTVPVACHLTDLLGAVQFV